MLSKPCLLVLVVMASFCFMSTDAWFWSFRRFRIRYRRYHPHPRTTKTIHTTMMTTTQAPTTTTPAEEAATTTVSATTTQEPTTTTVVPLVPTNCGETINLKAGESVNITSPNYPNNFANTDNCFWNISAPDGCLIQIIVRDLDLPGCNHKLNIDGNGDFTGISECGKIFGLQNVITHDTSLQIKFQADSNSSPEKGFLIHLHAVKTACDVNLCENSGECLTTNNNRSFECNCLSNSTGHFCETPQMPVCPEFPNFQDFRVPCCYDIPNVSPCEAETACTYVASGCTFDCGAFQNDIATCDAIPSCSSVTVGVISICAFLGPNGEILLPPGVDMPTTTALPDPN